MGIEGRGPNRGLMILSSKPTGCANARPMTANEVRAGDQHEDCQGARPHRAALVTCPRRRGDRIKMLFAAVHESGYGTFYTSQLHQAEQCGRIRRLDAATRGCAAISIVESGHLAAETRFRP
jgi:hypothetical protein